MAGLLAASGKFVLTLTSTQARRLPSRSPVSLRNVLEPFRAARGQTQSTTYASDAGIDNASLFLYLEY